VTDIKVVFVIYNYISFRKSQQTKLEILMRYMNFWVRIGILWDGLLLELLSLR